MKTFIATVDGRPNLVNSSSSKRAAELLGVPVEQVKVAEGYSSWAKSEVVYVLHENLRWEKSESSK